MNTVNDVMDHVNAMIDAHRSRARESGAVEAVALGAVVNALTNVVDELSEAAPDPGLYIAPGAYGDPCLWRDDGTDRPQLIVASYESEPLWNALVEGRFPVREEATDGVQ